MKRSLVVCALLAAFFCPAAYAAPTEVYLVNHSTVLSDSALANMLPALQAQVSGEFNAAWNLDAHLQIGEAPLGAWNLEITDQATISGALGYHDVCSQDGHGYPCGFVFAQKTLDAGGTISSVLDHELLEMLADPYTQTTDKVGSRFYIREVCDSPESDAYAYTRPGADGSPVLLSDFVTPFFFRVGHVGPYDYTGSISRPLQVLPNGYVSWWQNGSWHQKFAHGRRGVL